MTVSEAREELILVDQDDKVLGTIGKEEAHKKGLLHRAISVFIFNNKRQLLLQKRSIKKYHSGGLWTNSCCSHPRPGENAIEAAHRRLNEEMGIQSKLSFAFSFLYKSKFENGLIEHEFDHVFFGTTEQTPSPNVEEVEEWKYMSMDEIRFDIKLNPQHYTSWFKICLDEVIKQSSKLKVA